MSWEHRVEETDHLDYTTSVDNSQFRNASTATAVLEDYHEFGSLCSSMLREKSSSSLT